ncbi:transmembrane protein [Perilla frutescens var. frutescens]|nr:transmembrane protein [Perilla frutescens var. frutescens]
METPKGLWASLWNFFCFLPFFTGLLILGFIKGIIMFPVIFLIMTIGISGIIVIILPIHCFYTYYCILSTKQFGPALKFVICICLAAVLISWPPVGIFCSVLSGAAYGLFAPILATFQAVEEGKTSKFSHCISDGTWSAVEGSFTMIRDFSDVCYHSYFSIMDDLQHQEGKYYEIRLLHLPLALIAGILGIVVDLPMISTVALCKSPYMLVKGWHRLLQDCVGREGPFLETLCMPFAGLAILLWPLVVVGAVFCSIVSTIFLGAYAAVIVYQESSFWLGLCYIVASVSNYDEYSNDVLDLPEGSCFPRFKLLLRVCTYAFILVTTPCFQSNLRGISTDRVTEGRPLHKPLLFLTSSSSRTSSKNPSFRRTSLSSQMLELKPLELADGLFKECQRQGEVLVAEGIIKLKDIENAKNRVMAVGLPAYCILRTLVRSARADSGGILLSDDVEITSTNRPKDAFFEWFLNPLLIIKDQIKADNLSEMEEQYLGKLVLFNGNAARLKNSHTGPEPESQVKRAELEALARRLIGITKSISRYPTFRRRFDRSMQIVLEELGKKNGGHEKIGRSEPQTVRRSASMFARIFT